MTVKELRVMAQRLGLKPRKLRKAELIKSIQKAEGNFDCFGTAVDFCDQDNCLFREDCIPKK
ncbi:MAG: Rho termination factor N-terminal domain-containing protein [Deltaproteobacteria bacterium]|nr:Rho termination factor N-terminal domain-containing protein [Deltaproteobacteria bacterium]MBW2069823.1 Rho termination factor N-terminal domain-containing protein [Deltaproteobacteria bacterium]